MNEFFLNLTNAQLKSGSKSIKIQSGMGISLVWRFAVPISWLNVCINFNKIIFMFDIIGFNSCFTICNYQLLYTSYIIQYSCCKPRKFLQKFREIFQYYLLPRICNCYVLHAKSRVLPIPMNGQRVFACNCALQYFQSKFNSNHAHFYHQQIVVSLFELK